MTPPSLGPGVRRRVRVGDFTPAPDRVRVPPSREKYVRGFVYIGDLGPVAWTANEMIWIRYLNPLEGHVGRSHMVPLRLSVDMWIDATRFNRNFFKNSAQPDVIFTTDDAMSDEEMKEFCEGWEKRYKGPGNAHRPAIATSSRTSSEPLAMRPPREGVYPGAAVEPGRCERHLRRPYASAIDFQRATFSNVNAAERLFWRDRMVPEMVLFEEQLNQKLLPLLRYLNLRLEFDLSSVEAIREAQTAWADRDVRLLDREVLTINEVRRRHNLPDVPWGDWLGERRPRALSSFTGKVKMEVISSI